MARKLIVEIVGDSSSLQKALGTSTAAADGFAGRMSAVGSKLRSIGKHLTMGLTLPIVGIGYEATKSAVSFQNSMELLATQAGVPQAKIAALSQSVLGLAGPTATAPDELSAGLYHLTSQGLKGAKSLEALRIAAEGAKMGQANLEDVTNALGGVLASKVKGVHSYSQAMGELNAIVGSGDMRMQDLADAMGTGLASVAAVAHVNLVQVGAALATLGDNNIRGAKAGTLLNSTLRILGHQSKAGITALQDLGVNSDRLQQKLAQNGLSGALDYLKARIDATHPSTARLGSDLSAAFGGKQSTGIKILLDQIGRFHTKLKEVAKGGATFAANWKEYTKTTAYSLAQTGASMRAAGISIGDILLPLVSKLVNYVSDAANWFTHLSHGVKTTILVVAGVAAAIGPVLSVLGALATAIGFIATPIGLVVAGFALFAGAIAAAVLWPDKLKHVLEKMGVSAKTAGKIVGGLRHVFQVVKQAGEWLVGAIRAHWDTIKQILSDAWTVIRFDVQAGVDEIKFVWDNFGGLIVSGVKIVWKLVEDTVRNGLQVVKGIFEVISGLIHGDWSKVWKGIQDIVGGTLKEIGAVLQAAVSTIGNAASAVGRAIWRGITWTFGEIKRAVYALVNANIDVINGLINAYNLAFGWLTGNIPAIGHLGAKMGSTFGQNMTSAIQGALSGAQFSANVVLHASGVNHSGQGPGGATGPPKSLPGHAAGGFVLRDHVAVVHRGELITPYSEVVKGAGRVGVVGGGSFAIQTVNNFNVNGRPIFREVRREKLRAEERGGW